MASRANSKTLLSVFVVMLLSGLIVASASESKEGILGAQLPQPIQTFMLRVATLVFFCEKLPNTNDL